MPPLDQSDYCIAWDFINRYASIVFTSLFKMKPRISLHSCVMQYYFELTCWCAATAVTSAAALISLRKICSSLRSLSPLPVLLPLSPSPLVDWHFFLMLPACCSIHCNHSCTATAVPNCHCLDKTKQYRFIIEVAFTTTALLSFLEPLVVIDKLFLPLCHYVQDLDGTIQYFVDQNQWI